MRKRLVLTQHAGRCSLFVLATLTMVSAICVAGPRGMRNPYQSLEDKARQALDRTSIRALFEEINGRTLFGPLPASIMDRLVRAQESFIENKQPTTNEEAVAVAVNGLGSVIDGTTYSGTNALQVRLLRVSMFTELRDLLKSPSPAPNNGLFSDDLSPAGGVFMAFLLLRQKLTNPAWFGDPDEQNRRAAAHRSPDQGQGPKYRSAIQSEEPQVTRIRVELTTGLASESGSLVPAFNTFLDQIGIGK